MKVRAKFMMQEHRQYGYGGGHVQHTFVFRPIVSAWTNGPPYADGTAAGNGAAAGSVVGRACGT